MSTCTQILQGCFRRLVSKVDITLRHYLDLQSAQNNGTCSIGSISLGILEVQVDANSGRTLPFLGSLPVFLQPPCTSIKGLMLSINWYAGYLEGYSWGVLVVIRIMFPRRKSSSASLKCSGRVQGFEGPNTESKIPSSNLTFNYQNHLSCSLPVKSKYLDPQSM